MALPKSRGCAKERRRGRGPVVWMPVRHEGRGVAGVPDFGGKKAVAEFVIMLQNGDGVVGVS